jgi:hypothetical protein
MPAGIPNLNWKLKLLFRATPYGNSQTSGFPKKGSLLTNKDARRIYVHAFRTSFGL